MTGANPATSQQTGAAAGEGDHGRGQHLFSLVRAQGGRLGVPAVLVILILVFSVLKPSTFATGSNAATIAQEQMVLLVVAMGSLLPLIVGEFDLSVGYVASTCALVEAQLAGGNHWNPVAATIATLAVALVIGCVNAFLVVGVGINSFIATLGTGTVLSGLGSYISNDQTLFQGIPPGLSTLGSGYWHGIPIIVFAAAAFVAVTYYVLKWTPLGRYMYATGGGREAARLSGVSTSAIRASSLVVSGVFAGCAGLLDLGLVGSASASIGPELLLPALAACFLGTTMGENGRFNVFGTIIAIFLIAVGIASLEQLGAPNWVEPVFDGGALIVAVALTLVGKRVRGVRKLAADAG